MAEFLVLIVVSLCRTMLYALFYVLRNEKRGACTEVFLKFCKKDMDASEVEITEMDVLVEDGLQPCTQVGRLRVARHGQESFACEW